MKSGRIRRIGRLGLTFGRNGRNGRRWVKFVEIGGREKFLKENTDFCSESLVNLTKPGPVVYGD